MGELLRTFVAIRCCEEVSSRLRLEAERLARIDPVVHLASGGVFHLTLQFLGDTRDTEVHTLSKAIAEAARDSSPMELSYRGLGAFPDARRARVVWVGVREEPEGALAKLVRGLAERLGPLGFPGEGRKYAAHVTLGRLRGRPSPELVAAIESRSDLDLGSEEVSDLAFILSRPDRGRYHYIDLTKVRLGEDGSHA